MDAFAHVTEIKMLAALLIGCFCYWRWRKYSLHHMEVLESKPEPCDEDEPMQQEPVKEGMKAGEEEVAELEQVSQPMDQQSKGLETIKLRQVVTPLKADRETKELTSKRWRKWRRIRKLRRKKLRKSIPPLTLQE